MPTLSYSPWFKKTYSVSKPVESAATSNESQDMEDKGDAQEADGAKVDKKSTSTEKNVAIATPQSSTK